MEDGGEEEEEGQRWRGMSQRGWVWYVTHPPHPETLADRAVFGTQPKGFPSLFLPSKL